MNKVFNIVKKDFKTFVRSRSSALVIFLGPLLIVLLVGIAFTNTQFAINIGTYSGKYTALTDSVVDKLSLQQFSVTKFTSEASCINSVKQGVSHICVVFPPNFEIKEGVQNEVTFYVDFTRINLVYMLLDIIAGKVDERAKEISLLLTSDIITKIKFAEGEIEKDKVELNTIKNSEETLTAQITKGIATLSAMDLSVDRKALKFDDIKSFLNDGQNNLNQAKTAVDDAKTSVAGSNLDSGNKTDILANLDLALEKLEEASKSLSTGSPSAKQYVDEAVSSIDALENRLKDALKRKTVLKDELNLALQSLNQSKQKLSAVADSLTKMQESFSSLQITNASQIVSPITTNIKPVTVERSFFTFTFPTLIALIIMITAILLASTLVIAEKNSIAFFRNTITPTSDIIFNIAAYLTSFITIFMQLAIFFIIAGIFFKIPILRLLPVTFVVLVLVTTFFIFLGMLVGYIFRSSETGTLASIAISAMLLFFSSLVLPLETLPGYFKTLASLNPFVLSETMLKQAIVFKLGFVSLGKDMLIMLGYSIVAFGAMFILQRIRKSHYILHRHEEVVKGMK